MACDRELITHREVLDGGEHEWSRRRGLQQLCSVAELVRKDAPRRCRASAQRALRHRSQTISELVHGCYEGNHVEHGATLCGLRTPSPTHRRTCTATGRAQRQRPEAPMSQVFDEETHRNLLARVPDRTGHEIGHWLRTMDEGPIFFRFVEKASRCAANMDSPMATPRRASTNTAESADERHARTSAVVDAKAGEPARQFPSRGLSRFFVRWPSRASTAWVSRCSGSRRGAGTRSRSRPGSPSDRRRPARTPCSERRTRCRPRPA